MFHVWDGNHRLQAWLPVINKYHSDDLNWHYSVESIVLEVKGAVGPLLSALHQVNWYAFLTSYKLLGLYTFVYVAGLLH